MLGRGPAELREQVRAWLDALLGARGRATVALDEPADWSGWDESAGA